MKMLSNFDKTLKPIDDKILELNQQGLKIDAVYCSEEIFKKITEIAKDFITFGREKLSELYISDILYKLDKNISDWYI